MDTVPDVPARARALRAEVDDLQQRVAGTVADVDRLLGTADPAVRLTFDSHGLLEGILIDPRRRRQISAEQLLEQIDAAVQLTPRGLPTLHDGGPGRCSGAMAEDELGELTAAARVASEILSSEITEATSTTASPHGQVTVVTSALTGVLREIHCDLRWLATTSDDDIITMIVATARRATLRALEEGVAR